MTDTSPSPGTSFREMRPALAIAAGLVLLGAAAGVVAGAAVRAAGGASPEPTAGARLVGATSDPSPTWTARPTPSPTRSPPPTPSPTPSPSTTATPTTAPSDGELPPPLPPIDIAGADPATVAAIGQAVDALGRLSSFRFETGVSGRSLADLSVGSGLNFGTRGDFSSLPPWSVDMLVAFQMVEFDGAAAISSTDHVVAVGDQAWTLSDGEPARPTDGASLIPIIESLMPHAIAARVLVPFAGGFELVGPEERAGVPAIHYRLTPEGIAAYAGATGIDGTWIGDVWIAQAGGHLLAVQVTAESPGGGDGLFWLASVTDVNDPGIVIAVPR